MRLKKYHRGAQMQTRNRIRAFVPHYLTNGMNAIEALRAAKLDTAPTEKGNYNRAAVYAKHWLTQHYINKMVEKIMDEKLGTLEEKRKLLWDIAQHTTEKRSVYDKEGTYLGEAMVDPKAATGAVGELNKMDGDHAAIKLQANGEVKQKVIIKTYDGSKRGGDEDEDVSD